MNYANILTGEIWPNLPSTLALEGQVIQGATLEHWAKLGWRKVTAVASPTPGYRVERYGVQAVDGLTCELIVLSQVALTADAAAQVEADKASAAALVEASGTGELSALVKALAEVLAKELTDVRKALELEPLTAEHFTSALKTALTGDAAEKL